MKRRENMKTALILALCCCGLSGCIIGNLISTPIRIVGAIVSIVPVVGDTADKIIDEVASTVEKAIPF